MYSTLIPLEKEWGYLDHFDTGVNHEKKLRDFQIYRSDRDFAGESARE
jgi:hypothetical protein